MSTKEERAAAFKAWIGEQQKRRGISQRQLAATIGVSAHTVSAWLNPDTCIVPKHHVCGLIAQALKGSARDLVALAHGPAHQSRIPHFLLMMRVCVHGLTIEEVAKLYRIPFSTYLGHEKGQVIFSAENPSHRQIMRLLAIKMGMPREFFITLSLQRRPRVQVAPVFPTNTGTWVEWLCYELDLQQSELALLIGYSLSVVGGVKCRLYIPSDEFNRAMRSRFGKAPFDAA